jgi:Tetratricopeptide Repeats-Sensor
MKLAGVRAFIVRPFGVKSGIDFERVERELIDPALTALGITGRTTAEIVSQGNIRTDMFQRLLTADLVVADLSIHNANVFYELGIRHALRNKRTFLLRSRADEVPFDLKTDRYLAYDKDDPAASLSTLTEALSRTLDSDRADSPVYQLLPGLPAQDPAAFQVVPPDFSEEVELARREARAGDLALLAEEAAHLGFEWGSAGLRAVGRAQFDLKALEAARTTWENLRRLSPADFEANRRLATVYQFLGDFNRSEEAVRRGLASADATAGQRAELHALLASNAKQRWLAEWNDLADGEREARALRSPFLQTAVDEYARGFAEDLNHFYSGLNAAALLTVQSGLAAVLPEVWGESFETDEDAERALAAALARRDRLVAAVEVALDAVALRGAADLWSKISAADLVGLTSSRASRVAAAYRRALADAPPFALTSVRRQLVLYERLGVIVDNARAGIAAIDEQLGGEPPAAGADPGPARVLLFTGHRVDPPGREKPRFPPAAEGKARAMIREAVGGELARAEGGRTIGLAGGASGGDVLFHEVCGELGVPTTLYLAVPRDLYVRESVADGGPGWVERFDRLLAALPVRVLGDSLELPRWARDGSAAGDYSAWERNNRWTLHNALAYGAAKVTLIALWNGEKGDGPGGTADMVATAEDRGALIRRLDAKRLLDAEG